MLTLTAQVLNLYKTKAMPNKETGEITPEGHKVQLQWKSLTHEGHKIEMQDFNVHQFGEKWAHHVGKLILLNCV